MALLPKRRDNPQIVPPERDVLMTVLIENSAPANASTLKAKLVRKPFPWLPGSLQNSGGKMFRTTMRLGLLVAGFGSAQAAGFDCSKFTHNADGSWQVVQALEIKGPHGRIDFTPNETYTEGHEKMGLDLAKLLNANCEKK